MIALVHGPDAALAQAAVATLVAAHDPSSANTSRFDARETSLPQITAAAGSAAFFGGGRVVVVSDLMQRVSRGGGKAGTDDGDEGEGGAGVLDLGPLFAAVPSDNLLVLVDATLAAVPAAVKRAAPANAIVRAGEPPRGHALLAWIGDAAQAAGGKLDPKAARLLVETLYPQSWSAKPANPRYDRPPDTALLRNEVAKLVLAAHPEPVTVEHVRSMVAGAPDDRIFRFVEAAEGGRLGPALVELGRLLAAGEEPAKLTAQLYQQIELAAVLAAGPGVDPVAAGRDLGLSNPARMAGIAGGRGRRGNDGAYAAVAAASATDRRLKRGRLRHPEDALYGLLAGPAGNDDGGT